MKSSWHRESREKGRLGGKEKHKERVSGRRAKGLTYRAFVWHAQYVKAVVMQWKCSAPTKMPEGAIETRSDLAKTEIQRSDLEVQYQKSWYQFPSFSERGKLVQPFPVLMR